MNKLALLVALLVCCCCAFGSTAALQDCPAPYSSCNLGKDGYINVHLVSHTHDDVGWLKTVDQYYYGSNNGEQTAAVQYVLDTVVQELAKDPAKRFVYVEIAYFWRWWNEQDDPTKSLVKTLVSEGRLEFVIGAWCMNDEATTYYQDIIDQQTLGLKFILKEFGNCARPRSAWQIDPFGHSREQASLFAQFGFDGLFLGRTDYQDFDYRGKTQTREMLWQASANLGLQGQLFTGVLPNGYNPPGGFCFDAFCGDDPIMDDPRLDEYNVDQKVNDFINQVNEQANSYKTSNLIMTLGSDFQYSNAHMWFKNLDKLIFYVNQRQTNGSKINIFYSTTACYLYSLNQANTTWTVKTDDFFPYAHRPHAFWTGYFTSRAALKDYVRRTNNYLQAVRQLATLANLNSTITSPGLDVLERAMGVAQHHDAVSGTERQHVANDYAKRLARGTNQCVDIIAQSFKSILETMLGSSVGEIPNLYYCSLLNITECTPIENADSFTIIVYNPLARPVKPWIKVPTVSTKYVLTDVELAQPVVVDFVGVYDEVKAIPERNSQAQYNMVFAASLDALGFKVYTAMKQSKASGDAADREPQVITKDQLNGGDTIVLHNDFVELTFGTNGNLMQLENLDTSIKMRLNQQFCIYQSMKGNNSDGQFQASGAYIFRPANNTPECLTVKNFTIYNGQQVSELHQVYGDWLSLTIRLYRDSKGPEFEWQVGPIDVSDNEGKEVVIKFDTDLNSKSLFYTDSNGREILQRKRDFRPSWPNFNQTEDVAGNYYPINSRIFIRDEDSNQRQFTVVTDRSQGGSSIQDGSIEIMLHRRILNDDALGVSEPLNEPGAAQKGLIVKGQLVLLFNTTSNSARLHRDLAQRINTQPLLTFATNQGGLKNNRVNMLLQKLSGWGAIPNGLPDNLHLLTLTRDDYVDGQTTQNSFILRLEHFYELNEDAELSQPVTINLQKIFNQTFELLGVEELALGANMDVNELNQRLKWNAAGESSADHSASQAVKTASKAKLNDIFQFTFVPMQIRTFRVWFLPK